MTYRRLPKKGGCAVRFSRLVLVVATMMVLLIATAAPAMAQEECGWIWSQWSSLLLVC